ncbi:hypothetical protein [Clostridium sp. AM58-1XD]|uniref:hypothetical protein n=1 Tax=Clostridium sp. AM58-1XD TaxID=2292307 RepID=UPI000E47D1F7|nr:hypothetical protein [Clostridium sp. AM58-1XD]
MMEGLMAGGIICIIAGAAGMALGFRIWWKQKINLICIYRHDKVKQEDVEEYTQQMGKACALDGLGALSMGAFWILFYILGKEELIYMGLLTFFIAVGFSAVMMYRAQKRYA